MKPKVIIAGFMRAGTHSLQQELKDKGKDPIIVDEVLYNKDFKIEELMRSYYGDVPVYFIKRRDEDQHRKSLKRVQRLWRLRLLGTGDLNTWCNYDKYINRWKEVFSSVAVLYLEDANFKYHNNKTNSRRKLINYVPLDLLLLWKNLKYKSHKWGEDYQQ